ncbi:hypothetical protein CBS147321_3265 [Aspergillus niger]|nr:hypothetical protein CBS12448_4071 [Aspergillus niger]KAI2925073.1 hypothetical protein CBS147371_631 [Aspergillus niger]KAI2946800.1 hypothetical protein CBS147321_3265 [Aspergillus niger]KAI2947520.1 hypothetical protein CBS147322_6719 [Aspergillus niger]KAI2975323.1 hypothetical protein CBS147323_1193 [Aspergillus niger]
MLLLQIRVLQGPTRVMLKALNNKPDGTETITKLIDPSKIKLVTPLCVWIVSICQSRTIRDDSGVPFIPLVSAVPSSELKDPRGWDKIG